MDKKIDNGRQKNYIVEVLL